MVINNIDISMEACIPVALHKKKERKDNYNFKDPFTESLFTWQPYCIACSSGQLFESYV